MKPHSVTLVPSMGDLERGKRISAAREAKRLTQTAVVGLINTRAGTRLITIRGYQSWEAGGGIRWPKMEILAEVLGVAPEYLMLGDPLPDPDPFADRRTGESQLDRIERLLNDHTHEISDHARIVRTLLHDQTLLLEEIRRLVRAQQEIRDETAELQRLARALVQGRPEADPSSPAGAPARSEDAKNRREEA